MLTHLTINNFAIVKSLNLSLEDKMSVITGETGAGKSIAIDALSLCLGYRSESSMIREGSDKADVCATFHMVESNPAYLWLKEHELLDEDNPNECILRRILTTDGRSRAFVNNRSIPIAKLRELGQYLIHLNGQHAPQLLLKSDYQLEILDNYAKNSELLEKVKKSFKDWKSAQKKLQEYQQKCQENLAIRELLEYQVAELDEFDLKDGEFEELEIDHKRLANSEELAILSSQVCNILSESDENVQTQLFQAVRILEKLADFDEQYQQILTTVSDALIYVQEASSDLGSLANNIEVDPNAFNEIDSRISKAISLARKHHISAKELSAHHRELRDKLDDLLHFEDSQDELLKQEKNYYKELMILSNELYQSRKQAASVLSEKITAQIKTLAMENAQFFIDVLHNDEKINSNGADLIIFNLRSNLGQKPQPLSKIASGGELSRISLAVQVLTASKRSTPTIIFDEVDVGISGKTASSVGKLLQELAQKCQVLCVTHLPQVAAFGDQHFNVEKYIEDGQTQTSMIKMNNEQRVDALARLLAGDILSKTSRDNAKELLKMAMRT